MKYTDGQGLPYPVGADLGAGARQLQDLAELLETKVNAVDAGWLLRRNPPSWITRRTTAQTIAFGAYRTVIWESTDVDNTGNRAPLNAGSTTLGRLATEGHAETWWIGAYAMFAGGTPTQSERSLRLVVESFDVATGASTSQYVKLSGFETASGGEQRVVEGLVRVPNNSTLRLQAYHLAAGAMTINAGSFMWATRVGQEL